MTIYEEADETAPAAADEAEEATELAAEAMEDVADATEDSTENKGSVFDSTLPIRKLTGGGRGGSGGGWDENTVSIDLEMAFDKTHRQTKEPQRWRMC